jgi:type IV secretory pathway VirB6-like protein
MKEAGCEAEAKFNHDPSGDRVLGAFLVLLAAILVMVLLMLVAGTLVAAQLGVVIALALSPFAFVSGALPGSGRVLFWRWVGGYLQALAGVVMMAVMLSLFLVGTAALLLATASDALIV